MDAPEILLGATICVILFKFGFHALDKSHISNPVSSFLKHSILIAACHSSTSALRLSPQTKISFCGIVIFTLLFHPDGSLVAYSHIFVFALCNFTNFFFFLCDSNLILKDQSDEPFIGALIHLSVGSSIVLAGGNTDHFNCVVLCVALVTSLTCVIHIRRNVYITGGEKKGKLIKFSIGILGTILFPNFFSFTSASQVVAFFFFTVTWLGILCLPEASDEFGVFGFLISAFILGFTEILLGLWLLPFLAYGSSMVLLGLPLSIETQQRWKWS